MRRFPLCLLFLLGCPAVPSETDETGDSAAAAATDADQDGFAADDCDDADDDIHPGAAELCNRVDDDCDGTTDVGATDAVTVYADLDGDGFGDSAAPTLACAPGVGQADNDSDCDDTRADVNANAVETCNGVDDDCDGTPDTEVADAPTWYPDVDGDGYGDSTAGITQCDAPDAGAILDGNDCDDTRATVFPGGAEVCDGLDGDCDAATPDAGVWLEDAGTWTDWTPTLAVGVDGSPALVALVGGTLHVCEGTWYTNLTVSAPAAVVGHGGADVAVLDAGAVGSTLRTSGAAVTLSVSDLTIVGGSGTVSSTTNIGGGGGIMCDGDGSAAVELDNVRITGGGGYAGGGIFAQDCDLILVSSTISDNAASYGGGVLALGYSHAANVQLEGSVIEDNWATMGGGGMYMQAYEASSLQMVNSLFEGNTADSYGGGLTTQYNLTTTCTGDAATAAGFYDNDSPLGAAAYLEWAGYGATFTSTSCDFGEESSANDNDVRELTLPEAGAYVYGDDATFVCSSAGCI